MHLSLKLKQGNDETVKRHLAGKLKETKEQMALMKRSLESLEEAYTKATYDYNHTHEQVMTELLQLREENRRVVDQLKIEEHKRINEMKESAFSVQERMLLEQAEIQARAEADKREMSAKHERDIKAL